MTTTRHSIHRRLTAAGLAALLGLGLLWAGPAPAQQGQR